MNANPILLQKKYARVVELYAKENGISLEKALDVFYRSELCKLMSEEVSDMHCMSDELSCPGAGRRKLEYKIVCFCEQAE